MSLLDRHPVNSSAISRPSAHIPSPALAFGTRKLSSSSQSSSHPSPSSPPPVSTSTQSSQSLKEILAKIEQRVAERCQVDDEYQDSEDRIEFSVKSDYIEDVLDFLDGLPQSRIFRINYDIVFSEAHFSLKVAMPCIPHDSAASSWADINRELLLANFPGMDYIQIFTSSMQTTYTGQSGGKSADTNIVPLARFASGASGYPSVVVEVGYSESYCKLARDVEKWFSKSPEILTVYAIKLRKKTDPLCGILQVLTRSNKTGIPGVRCHLDFDLGLIDNEGYCASLAAQLRLFTHDYLMDRSAAEDARSFYKRKIGDKRPVVVDEMDLAGLTDKRLTVPTELIKRWLCNLKMANELKRSSIENFDLGTAAGYCPPTSVQHGTGLRLEEFD
ncbi:hypothetical protein E1B28_010867 [Marasmius oreades]|nr:uncharacterized protein E1B28_010867 [Marasmius oreades]KAG7089162.1 hypothetical protein E1B28_010867 [Marasmius oreades]